MPNKKTERICIQGSLFVSASREQRPAREIGLPKQWLDPAQTASHELRILTTTPIMLRDRSGGEDTLSWFDKDAPPPRLHPSTPIETWIIEETNPEITPDLIEVIRFCLYDLPRAAFHHSDIKRRRRLLERIENDRRLRTTIARHVLETREDKVLAPRNMTPLLQNRITSRTLQIDRNAIRERLGKPQTGSVAEVANSDEWRGEGGNDSTAEKEGRGVPDTPSTEEEPEETPNGGLNDTPPDGAVAIGININAKRSEVAREFYSRLRGEAPELPEFPELTISSDDETEDARTAKEIVINRCADLGGGPELKAEVLAEKARNALEFLKKKGVVA